MANKTELARQVNDDSLSVDLGDDAADTVTGFSGTVTTITLFEHAGARVLLENMSDYDLKSEWFDAARVK